MNYSEALSFTFRDEQWLKKLGIGGLFNLLCWYAGLFFVLGFFVVGYYIGVLRNVMKGEERPLPDWSDLGKVFVDGLLGTIIAFLYLLVIGGISAALIVGIANSYNMTDGEKAVWIVLVSLLTLFGLIIFINYALMRFAATENFGAAFSLSGMARLLRSHLGDFLAISFFSLILNALLFLAGLGILSPFTNFWGLIIQAHLFGQCARTLDYESRAAVQSA